ncbi:hypothetical protein AB8880_09000 [Alphaproteobacteria bacterium LSUCC0684]
MDNRTACEIIGASGQASEMKKNFICAQDGLHQTMLGSPWPVLFYAVAVLFGMFLVYRAANVPHRQPPQGRKENGGGKQPPR